MSAVRSWLALTLLVALVRCQTNPEEEEEVSFTERVPLHWLRPIPFIDEEEEGFTERIPQSWLRPLPFPEKDSKTRYEPAAPGAESPTVDAQGTTATSPSSGDLQTGSSASSSGGHVESTLSSQRGNTLSSVSPQEKITPSSGGPQEGTTLSSASVGELTATQPVPDSWQPRLPPPEVAEVGEDLEFRQPPAHGEARLWVTPSRAASMEVQEVDADTVLPDFGNFQLADGVAGEIASPNYPGMYPRYTWNTWKFTTTDPAGTLHLSCDVIELGRGDFLVVRPDSGGRQSFHSHVTSIEASAVGSMLVEIRSDREDEGRLHCSVRAAVAEGTQEPGSGMGSKDSKTTLRRVDINDRDCGKTKFNTRIVGGAEPPPHAFPWLVALQTRRGRKQFCGGTIINERFVVTAAHCVDRRKPAGLSIAVAKHRRRNDPTEKIFEVKKITMHEQYNRATQDRDIAIIELRQSLRSMISDSKGWVKPICLPLQSCRSEGNCYTSRSGIVAGWGLHDPTFFEGPETVQYVRVPIMSNAQCQKDYAEDRIGITSRMLCAGFPSGGKDSCQGDSGGPLAVVSPTDIYTLAGIVSFGKGCAIAGYPGVYVRVSELTGWIRTNSQL